MRRGPADNEVPVEEMRAGNPSEIAGLDAKLQARFGLEALHGWQREAIDALLHGSGRALVVAPTGGGKSLCYQLPATELEGTTLVVSPLIALMEDQVRALEHRGIAATFLASTLSADERATRERRLREGAYSLVYLAPERLAFGAMVELLTRLRPPLIAVDEAHCISQWGHDFRPDYLRLGEVLRALQPPRVLACTATATPLVRDEILQRLRLDPRRTTVVLRGFARPNLHLEARSVEGARPRRRAALDALRENLGDPGATRGAAIIYAGTRKATEQMADVVAQEGWSTAAYHAGLRSEVRAEVNARFASRALDVVVATTAFGMGIDRPDIRAVVHTQAPGSIEAYYQEVGRAGRDGQPAHGLLLTSSADFGLRRRLIERSANGEPVHPEHARRQWGLFLELIRYIEAGSCRHDFILRYFGDEQELLGGCGHCDVCERLEGADDPDRGPSEEEGATVRKALSGVARVRRRAGLRAVADMLRGTGSAKLRKLGLDSLSTHGLLRDRDEAWVLALLRRLIGAGLVDLTPDDFPVPYLTARGVGVMKGDEPVRVLLPPQSEQTGRGRKRPRSDAGAGGGSALAPGPRDAQLFEALRAARLSMAREHGIPAYVVCHDRTLAEIATHRPRTPAELEGIHGMGPSRIASWGERFLEVVRASP